jgi:hypothetical protein
MVRLVAANFQAMASQEDGAKDSAISHSRPAVSAVANKGWQGLSSERRRSKQDGGSVRSVLSDDDLESVGGCSG